MPTGRDRAQTARRLAVVDRSAALDELTALACRLLRAQSAHVAVVAEDRTVVAASGPAEASVGTRTARDASPDWTVVAEGRPLVVTDGPSYLGVPLVHRSHVVGVLAVTDPEPRSWTGSDAGSLEHLAALTAVELDRTVRVVGLERERLAWQLAVDAAGVGAFDWELATDELRWDERLLALFGLDRETFGGTIGAFTECVHPDDRERVGHALQQAIDTCGAYAAEYRILLPTGEVRWIGAKGHVLAGPDGTARRLLGAAYDTTANQDEEARVRRVLETMPSAFFALDREWRFTYLNDEARRLLGPVDGHPDGQVLWEAFPDAAGSVFEDSYRRAVATGQPVSFDAHYPAPLDRWYEVRAWPTGDGLSVYFNDVTDRRLAQALLDGRRDRAELLARVSETLTERLDLEEAVARLARLVVEVGLADWSVVTLVDSPSDGVDPGPVPHDGTWKRGLRDVAGWHADAVLRPLVARYVELRVPSLLDVSYLARSLTQRTPVVVAEEATERVASVFQEGEAQDLLRELGPESFVVVPLHGRGRVVGLLTLARAAGGERFDQEEVDTIVEVAARAGLAVDNARLYAQQRDLAEGLQRSLLTAPPQPEGLQVVVRYEPAAEAAQVGGDWYDAFLQRDGATLVAIGDVVGHDTEAAAAMAQLRNLLRGVSVTSSEGPAGVLRLVDEAVQTLQIDTTASAVLARFEGCARDGGQGLLRWANAGHPPPLVATPSDAGVEVHVLWPRSPEMLLGIDPASRRTDAVLEVRPGATVLLYTDGLVERRGRDLDTGVEELGEVFADLLDARLDLEDLCDALLARMVPERPDDDVAIVAVRLDPAR